MQKYLKQSFYEYIRNCKPAIMRYVKNTSLLIASVCLIITVIVLVQPNEKTCIKKPNPAGTSQDKNFQLEKDKKNSILRRFISYNQVKSFY